MKQYLLQIYVDIDANDDPDARSKATDIFKEVNDLILYNYTCADISKANLKQIKEGQEPRMVNWKPCID